MSEDDIDHLLGYVDAKDMFQRVLSGQTLSFEQGLPLHKALVIPDRISLTEVLEQFRLAHEDFAIVVNEYSLVVGVITLNDVMSTVMGDLVPPSDDAGFLMIMLRRVPKRTESVNWAGYKFEVMDVDSYRIDQVMVTRAAADLARPQQAVDG